MRRHHPRFAPIAEGTYSGLRRIREVHRWRICSLRIVGNLAGPPPVNESLLYRLPSRYDLLQRLPGMQLSRDPSPPPLIVVPVCLRAGIQIPSQLSSIKVNFVPCLFKVIIHLAAAGFFGGCLFSALRYSLVAWFFSVIALFQGITGIKALPVFHYSPDDMKHLSHTGNKCQLFAFAPV